MIDVRYKALGRYIPNFAYYKIVENEFGVHSLDELKSISAAMFRLEMAGDEDVSKCALRLTRVLKKEANPELRRDFRLWLNQFIRGYGIKPEEIEKIIDELEAGKMTLFEANIRKNFKKAEEKGIEKGKIETAKKMIADGFENAQIAKYTSLSEKEINELRKAPKKAA